MIAEFETSQPADTVQAARPEAQRSFTQGLLLGMVIGAVVMLMLLR